MYVQYVLNCAACRAESVQYEPELKFLKVRGSQLKTRDHSSQGKQIPVEIPMEIPISNFMIAGDDLACGGNFRIGLSRILPCKEVTRAHQGAASDLSLYVQPDSKPLGLPSPSSSHMLWGVIHRTPYCQIALNQACSRTLDRLG